MKITLIKHISFVDIYKCLSVYVLYIENKKGEYKQISAINCIALNNTRPQYALNWRVCLYVCVCVWIFNTFPLEFFSSRYWYNFMPVQAYFQHILYIIFRVIHLEHLYLDLEILVGINIICIFISYGDSFWNYHNVAKNLQLIIFLHIFHIALNIQCSDTLENSVKLELIYTYTQLYHIAYMRVYRNFTKTQLFTSTNPGLTAC